MDICIPAFFWMYGFSSLEYIPRSGIVGSCGNCLTFWGTANCFQSNCSFLHSHQQGWRFQFFHIIPIIVIFQGFLLLLLLMAVFYFVFFLNIVIQVGVKSYFIVVLVCIPLMTTGVEYFFMCLMAICIPSLENVKTFFSIVNWVIYIFVIELHEFFIYSTHKFLSRYIIYQYFLLLCGLSFHFTDDIT